MLTIPAVDELPAVEGDLRDDLWLTAVVSTGLDRTGLLVPLLKDNEIVGILALGRKGARQTWG
jgi:GAF domain-containing protein